MRGSVFFSRTSLAAMPTPSRSSDWNISRACCCVMPIVSNPRESLRRPQPRMHFTPQLCCGASALNLIPGKRSGRGCKLERPDARNQPKFSALAEIEFQAALIGLIEREINVFAQIGFEGARGKIQFQRGAVGNLRDARQAVFFRGGEVRH